jgi:hypothetical protein
MVQCPRCGTPIQPTWDWCHSCGFDPEGLKPVGWHASAALPGAVAAPPPAQPPSFAPPPGAGGQSFGPMGYAPPVYMGGPPTPPSKSGGAALAVILGVGLTFVLILIVLVGAVTLLGRSSSSKFSSVASAVPDGQPTTTVPIVWQPFSPPDHSFSIEFPGPPVERPLPANKDQFTNSVFYEHDLANRTEFAIAAFDLREDKFIADPTAYVREGVNFYTEGTGGKLGLIEPSDFAGMPATRFIVTEAKGYQHQAILIVGGKRTYIIVIATPIGQTADAATFEHFLSSFHISG